MDESIARFWESDVRLFDIFVRLEAEIRALYPDAEARTQKTCVRFALDGHPFCYVSPPKRAADRGRLIVTVSLPERDDDPRVAYATMIRPGRWTHHIRLSAPDVADAWLISRIETSRAFCAERPVERA